MPELAETGLYRHFDYKRQPYSSGNGDKVLIETPDGGSIVALCSAHMYLLKTALGGGGFH